MSKSIRNYFLRLAQGENHEPGARLLTPLLELASCGYGAVSNFTRGLYEAKILPRQKLAFPVVSVGNLTWGGTGKTPFVEYLATRVGDFGKTPLVLTRGYNHDEVRQLERHLPRAVIGVGKDRAATAKKISRDRAINLAILDDGFQHWPLERDLELVMINAVNPFGNGKLLPRGILRESQAALRRAHFIVISYSNLVPKQTLAQLKEKVQGIAPQAAFLETRLDPLFFYRTKNRARVGPEKLRDKRVTTFSGLAAPRTFQLLLSEMQIKPVRNFEFADHHPYSVQDLDEIKEVSQAAFADEIVTTEKDYYRTPEMITERINPLVLAVRLAILSGEEALKGRLCQLLGITNQSEPNSRPHYNPPRHFSRQRKEG